MYYTNCKNKSCVLSPSSPNSATSSPKAGRCCVSASVNTASVQCTGFDTNNLMLTHLPSTHYCHQKITEQKVAPDSLNRSIS